MKKSRFLGTAALAACLAAAVALPGAATAQWKPSGPVNLMIAFTAGGGADTQARLIAAELENRRGWKIVPQNVTGKGGVVMASKLKSQPSDGLTIGIAVTETFGYSMLAAKKPPYSADEFTFITTTAGSQMGLVVKSSRGWKTIRDLVASAKDGGTIRLGAMSPKLADLAYVVQDKLGLKFNTVRLKGGRAVLNAITAGDIDVGWIAGIQAKGVKAGELVNLLSAEGKRLIVSPDAPTLAELGIPFEGGANFVIVAPKGIPDAARKGYAAAVAEVLNDGSTKAAQFVQRAFGGPKLISGAALDQLIADGVSQTGALMAAAGG